MPVKCASCKNKRSNDRCPNSALFGLKFCGVHSKIKSPRVWVDINNVRKKVNLILKIWRGYYVRKCLKLAGPGVLKRDLCNNVDEIMSFESIAKVDPLDYFGFEENGKIYGFDIRTMLDILNRNLVPKNPYTREPLNADARSRLRQIYGYRIRNKQSTCHPDSKIIGVGNILSNRWLQICQIVEENGFYDINPDTFIALNKSQLYVFLNMIFNDIKTWAAEHKTTESKRFIYAFWIRNIMNKYANCESIEQYSFYVSTILLSILYNSAEPYNVVFIIMSSLYRL